MCGWVSASLYQHTKKFFYTKRIIFKNYIIQIYTQMITNSLNEHSLIIAFL